ncbi:MAG: SDR family oxidoreductase [Pseudomonadota bacterium]|nr:SDR family oxidoreductase [Pseudomonadota bacterium]
MRIVITGANRGIGLALARHYAAAGAEVHGTARAPERATELAAVPGVCVHALDVRSEASCAALAAALGDVGVDVLVNNAGVGAWEALDAFDGAQALAIYDTNALGPVRVTRALLPLLERARGKVFHIGSDMGSITHTNQGGAYAYRMSKAALGMAGRALANDLRDRGVASIVVHPGWVRTDMGGRGATLGPEECAEQLAKVFAARGIESTGRFYSLLDVELPW